MKRTIPREVGVINHNDSAESKESASELRRPESYDLLGEIGDLVERTSHYQKGTKALAGELDAAYSTVRDWTARPERFPLAKLPRLLRLAPPDDGFLGGLAAHMGFLLLPLQPSAVDTVKALIEAKLVPADSFKTATRIVRGLRRDDRQSQLWEG